MSEPVPVEPIPVNVITGALGVGKTTAIARLLAAKPAEQFWVVLLNEFTDTGVDAITLAAAARGAYDVRVIPGGCLCCTGELDFRRQLRQLLSDRRPDRIVIEPSGIGHPGAVIEELRGQERAGALRLASTIGLVDPRRLSTLEAADDSTERAQLESSDVLILAKADLASDAERVRFMRAAEECFPPKRWVGIGAERLLDREALDPPPQPYTFELQPRPALHRAALQGSASHRHEHSHRLAEERHLTFGPHSVAAAKFSLLDREACGWKIPREAFFNRVQLLEALSTDNELLRAVDRCKAVVRTGIEHWTLFNVSAQGVTADPCGWRQDSRVEVQLKPGVESRWDAWDRLLAGLIVR